MAFKTEAVFRPYVIDVEASGFGSRSYPIEVGLALDPDLRYCSLIRPAPDWTHWDSAAEQVHHISRKTLADFGKPLSRVAKDLNRLLKGTTVYTDGWSVDKSWITRLFVEAGISQAFHVSPLELILTEPQMDIWQDTKKEIISTLSLNRHRASTDAFLVQETFVRTRKLVLS